MLSEGDHIKITASKYPFPTVCADKQSTDWFHAISRTLKWNERERQKSFVVVEEGPAKEERKHRQPKHRPESTASAIKGDDDEEDEVSDQGDSDEEEEKFDIDDLSSGTSDAAPTAGSSRESSLGSSPGASPLSGAASRAAEAIMGVSPAAHEKARAESRSRPGVRSGVDSPSRYAPVPALPGGHAHGHVQWATSVPSTTSDRLSRAGGGTADIPTPTTALPTRRTRSRSPAPPTVHSHQHPRAFAVWGHDETDSNSSDNDP